MPVPFLDLKAQYQTLKPEIDAAIQAVVDSAMFVGSGASVADFETEFAAYCETKHCATVNSGTDALRLALMALGLRPGDEVATVANTFIATTEAITQAGGTIRFVDVDPKTMLMDPQRLEAAMTPRTRVVLPVHLTGLCADVDAIREIAQRHGAAVLEDACQAHGARYKGRRAGSMGVAGCFSFYPGKNLGAFGEGGAVVSDDAALIEKVKMLRDHGQARKYVHECEGYNARLDAIQAAVLRVKLRRLDGWNAARRRHAALYRDLLSGVPVALPAEPPECEHVYHLFVIQTKRRQALQDALTRNGIGWGLHYPIPLHLQEAYARLGPVKGSFPVAERLAGEILSLPMYAELRKDQMEEVARVVREALST